MAAGTLTARKPTAIRLCAVIVLVIGSMVVQMTGLDEASAPNRAAAPIIGATDLDHMTGIGFNLIQDQTIPVWEIALKQSLDNVTLYFRQ